MLRLADLAKAPDASTIRQAVLAEYVRVTCSDYGLFNDTVHDGNSGRVVFGQVLVEGPDTVGHRWSKLEGMSYADLGLGIEHISALDAVTAVTDSDLPSKYVDAVWVPLDVHCSLRINSLDGESFGGQISAVRVSSRPAYRRRDIRAAQSFLPVALGGLRMACRLSGTATTAASQLFKPDGTPWMQSVALFPPQLSGFGLTKWIRHLSSSKLPYATRVYDRFRLEAVALSGGGEQGILVSVWPLLPLRVPKILMLTPSQRQVASYAASGATVSEIAEHLERSPDTVKSHLKALYKELGVSSRVELRGKMQLFLTKP